MMIDGEGSPRGSGGVPQFLVLNRSIENSEATQLYNSGNGLNCSTIPLTPGSNPNATVTALDLYDGSSLSNFSLLVRGNGQNFILNTSNGTILINNVTHGLYNLTFSSTQAGGYFDQLYTNVVINETIVVGRLYQSILYLNATQIISNSQITNFNVSVPLQFNSSNSSGIAKLLLKAGSYTVAGSSAGYINTTKVVTVSALQEQTQALNFSTNRLRIEARSIITGAYISSFSVLLYNGSYSDSKTTTNGNITFDLIGGNYLLNFSSSNFADSNTTIIINSSSVYPNYTFNVYTSNSINVSIFDEVLGNQIYIFNGIPVNLEFSSTTYAQNYTTNTSLLYVDLLSPSEYRVQYSTNNYPKRNYYFTLENRTNNQIELYLLSEGNSTNVVVTINDNTGNLLEGATVYLERYYVNTNSYKVVAMEKTNAEGQVVFNVDFNDPFYKIFATFGNFNVETIGAKIFQTSFALTIETNENALSQLDNINGISSSIIYNNATGTFSMTAYNIGGISLPFSLIVSKLNSDGSKTELCTNSDTFASGTILCVANVSAASGSYVAEGYANIGGTLGNTLIDTHNQIYNTLQQRATRTFGREGLLMSLIVAGSFGLLGAGSGPAGALIGFTGGLAVSQFIGLIFFGNGNYTGLMVFISLIIFSGIMIWRMNR